MCNTCHRPLKEYIGLEIEIGTVTNAYTMLNPDNDIFVIKSNENNKTRKYMRWEILSNDKVINKTVFKGSSDRTE